MNDRRHFLKGLTAIGMFSTVPKVLLPIQKPSKDKIWGCLLHLSFDMWEDYIYPGRPFRGYRPYLRLSKPLWDDALENMSRAGMNMVIINIGDAIKYKSHPEIAVKEAWSTDMLKKELDRIRKMGLEPIPLLNFSAAHDTWLKRYSRMVSSQKYYAVCSDLIAEVINLFDNPRFFHIGMDEENASNQASYNYIVVRQGNLWWGDFYYLIGEIERGGARPWIWSDYIWHHPELFLGRMPKSVLQSNWYYGDNFEIKSADENEYRRIEAYDILNAHNFDQIPTGGYLGPKGEKDGLVTINRYSSANNIMNTVKYCTAHISENKLFGFLQTFWRPMIEEYRSQIIKSIQLAGDAKKYYELNHMTKGNS